ncbi:MAG TPA: aminotransferase class I/II-fold pyridoxal phosphate-dependent enzyme [Gemmatimonadaceae bacterium]
MTKRPRGWKLGTQAVHGGARDDTRDVDAPIAFPLFQATSYILETGTGDGLRYPRYGNAPNAEVVQRRIAAMEGAEASVVLSSGQGATACALFALLRPGDHLVASSWIYGGTRLLLEEEFESLGIHVTLVDPVDTRAWRKAMRKQTRAMFLESPVNPTCRVLDVGALATVAHQSGLAMVVDATFASPVNLRPIEHGADVAIHSATKFLNGHHDVLGGVVSGNATYIEEVRRKMMFWGQAPDPFACWLLERGMKTLDVRVQRQNESAQRVAEWCEKRKEVRRVHYPGLESHPDHEVAERLLDGFGGMVAIELSGGGRATEKFLRRLRVFRHAPSLGGVDSLVCEPRYTSHAGMSAAQRSAIGIPDGFVRLSIGVEDADDLIADLEHALR